MCIIRIFKIQLKKRSKMGNMKSTITLLMNVKRINLINLKIFFCSLSHPIDFFYSNLIIIIEHFHSKSHIYSLMDPSSKSLTTNQVKSPTNLQSKYIFDFQISDANLFINAKIDHKIYSCTRVPTP